jgi:NAD(P)-dependent dehydrogenase (short-subunit alcohol dehydrogenase family)
LVADAIACEGHIDCVIWKCIVPAPNEGWMFTDIGFRKLMDLKLFGPAVLTQAIMPHFKGRDKWNQVWIIVLWYLIGYPYVLVILHPSMRD